MDQEEYEKLKRELNTLLVEKGCYVYNSAKDQILKGILPITLDIDQLKQLTEQDQINFALAMNFYDGDMDLGNAEWTDDFSEARKIDSLYSLCYAINSLIWEKEFLHCLFFLMDENGDWDYDSLLTNKRDGDFIDKLLEDFI